MHRLPVNNGDECAGFPSASSFDRLLKCRASHLLSRRAIALGQVAHEWSPASELGSRKHLASTEGPEMLTEAEREDWESCQRKREEFIRAWLGNSQEGVRTFFFDHFCALNIARRSVERVGRIVNCPVCRFVCANGALFSLLARESARRGGQDAESLRGSKKARIVLP